MYVVILFRNWLIWTNPFNSEEYREKRALIEKTKENAISRAYVETGADKEHIEGTLTAYFYILLLFFAWAAPVLWVWNLINPKGDEDEE